MDNFVRLADTAIFKSRYQRWYLIDTHKRERERVLIEGGAEQVLLALFEGYSIVDVAKKFDLGYEELSEFIDGLVSDGLLDTVCSPVSSTVKCHDIEPPLDSVNVLITNACNLRCVHCYVESGKPMKGELDGDAWIRVLQETRQLGVFEINMSGGEATMHRDFVRIAEYIASVSTFNANLNTNGVRLTPEQEEVIAKAFTSVQISIDDAVSSRHDRFRGRDGSFDKTVATIRRLVDHGVETNIGFTLTQENLASIDDMILLAEDIGATVLNIGFMIKMGRARGNGLVRELSQSSVSDDPFMEMMYQKMRELAKRKSHVRLLLPFRVAGLPSGQEVEKQYICNGDNTQILYVMADGSMMPCDKLPMASFAYGNAGRDSLVSIWTSEKMRAFKLTSPRQLPKCRSCPHLKVCGGACVARAYQMGGSLESPDWTSCVIAQKFARDNK